MTLRISQCAVALGISLMALPGVALGQTPRYQSPYSAPAATPQQVTAPTLPAPPAITPNGTVVEDVIARVNDQIISRSDLERSEQQLAQELQQTNASPEEAAQRQKNLLRDMIDQQLLLSRGKELGINADAEVIRRLDEIRKQNKLDAIEDKDCTGTTSCMSLEKAARQQGVSFEDFKANIRNGVITQQVVRDEVGRRLQMTQTQEQAYYDEHKKEFEQPEQVRLSEILIPTAADASPEVVAQAKAKADEVAAKVAAGGKFDELAKTYSGGPTASQGGDLGIFKRGALAKVLEDKTFALKAGESTAPIRTRQGFVILKVTEHQEAGVAPLKEVEPQVQEAMYMQELQPALRAYLTKLRENAYIDIKPGFVDSGASPRETKPVFTAYTAPVVKKKKQRQKERFDRGGRFSAAAVGPAKVDGTAAASGAAPAANVVAASTGKTSAKVAKSGKQKKIKREKVRFGQAPRNSLPPGPQETTIGQDRGAGAVPAAVAEGITTAPGQAIAPVDPNAQAAATTEADPLAPQVEPKKKSRYAAREKELQAAKKQKKVAAAKEKAAAAPPPITQEEKEAQQTQAAPLGLNGDTAKKKKKKKVKGAAKERLQGKPKAPAAPAPEATPYRTPDLNPKPGTPAAPSSDKTTLPPANAPAPGALPQGEVAPATPGSPIPTPAPN